MANSMMDSILGMVTPEIKQALATRLGESSQAVQSGLGAATAATLGGLASKAGDSGFLGEILGLLGGGAGQSILGSLSSFATGSQSPAMGDLVTKFLPMVFGSQQSQIAGAISQRSGVSAASGMGLLKMAAPLVLGYLGKMQSTGSLTSSSLGSMLTAELPALRSYLPSTLLSGTLAGAAGVTGAAGRVASAASASSAAATRSKWLVPLGIAAALLIAWVVLRSMSGPKDTVQAVSNATRDAATTVANTAANAVNAGWAALGEMTKIKLPDGTEIYAPAKGVEVRLVNFLNDSSATVTEDTWFDFDRLLFDTGQATLQQPSQEQLHNIALILKAYPQAKIRIGGYTDNTGDPTANVKLSDDRANNVMAALTQFGVDPSRMTATGYGGEHPIADNSSEAGREQNRRVEIRLASK